MLLLGLTGSIATGKSTVSSILSSPPYNLPIVDADKVARQVVEPGTPGYNKIVSHFGPSTPDLLVPPTPENGGENGHNGKGRPLNRPALGRRVFGEGKDEDRTALNKIVHPAVRGEMYKQMLYAYLRGNWAVVLDVPLLFESGWEPLCGTIMVVAVKDAAVQMQRLRARDEHLTEEDAKKEIDRVMSTVKEGSPQWWAWMLLLFPPLGLMSGGWSYVRSWYIKRQWEQEKTREKAKL
jgi:dephospho-CoA kinase